MSSEIKLQHFNLKNIFFLNSAEMHSHKRIYLTILKKTECFDARYRLLQLDGVIK